MVAVTRLRLLLVIVLEGIVLYPPNSPLISLMILGDHREILNENETLNLNFPVMRVPLVMGQRLLLQEGSVTDKKSLFIISMDLWVTSPN